MKILVVTVSFPFPATGAEQLDRAEGMKQLVNLGHEVIVITKTVAWADISFIERTAHAIGIKVIPVPYRYSNTRLTLWERLTKTLGKLRNPLYLDGAAYEYVEPGIQKALRDALDSFKPDIVWFEYTYLWPLYKEVSRRSIPIITRSINFEPEHFLEEDGYTFFNYLRCIPKWFGEKKTVRSSDVLLAITPKEEKTYIRLGGKEVLILPLRGLPRYTTLTRPPIRAIQPLHVFFMGSSYNVAHNKAALALILEKIAPEASRRFPGAFVFHILGSKVPKELQPYFSETCIYEGFKYGDELDVFIAGMDVALIPSLMGAGQQQKVFEPLTRGIPTITSSRAIADFPLKDGVHYLNAHRADEFVDQLGAIRDKETRERLSLNASQVTIKLFSKEKLDSTVQESLLKARRFSRRR